MNYGSEFRFDGPAEAIVWAMGSNHSEIDRSSRAVVVLRIFQAVRALGPVRARAVVMRCAGASIADVARVLGCRGSGAAKMLGDDLATIAVRLREMGVCE